MNTYRNIHARQQKHGRSRKKRTGHLLHFILPMLCLILLLCTLASYILNRAGAGLDVISPISSLFHGSARDEISHYASSHGYDISDYPQSLIDLYDRNRETKDFVFEYPMKKSKTPPIDLSDLNTSTVPLLMQWDQRWGYQQYAGDLFGLSGCGPTCLSMVTIYLTGNTDRTPAWMAEFASSHGYASDGNGSYWSLFSEGGPSLGLDVTEIPLDEQRIIDNLQVGNPIVAVLGPGDFTTTGHFIVLTAYQDGQIKVNDPNSRENSEKLWDYDRISGQIKNLWVFR